MTGLHATFGTWSTKVDLYATVSEYVRQLLLKDGFAPDAVVAKPNCVLLPAPHKDKIAEARSGFLFVGRMTAEKGIDDLLRAWAMRPRSERLTLIGEGEVDASGLDNVEVLGRRPVAEVFDRMKSARCVIVPGRWAEPFSRVVIEALAQGAAVIAARVGGNAEAISDGHNGRLFSAGNIDELSAIISTFEGPGWPQHLGAGARATYLERYAPDVNVGLLLDIYRRAASRRAGQSVA